MRIEGDVDLPVAASVRRQLEGHLGLGAARRGEGPGPAPQAVVLDLAAVPFVDSSGLGVLIGALKGVRDRGGTLVLAGAVPVVQRMLVVTGLATVVRMADGVDEAARLAARAVGGERAGGGRAG